MTVLAMIVVVEKVSTEVSSQAERCQLVVGKGSVDTQDPSMTTWMAAG